ncbi:nucleolar pre-ribosomal-associated protein 1-like isoform X1 [Hoplias malabaricus]|uniref:nucleolar pre-ribosomal-associated protein 1-like isoform X1 n=1 Tax=Hoplias malabaricus TaxID=27720 RepID=UPI003462EE83
MLSLLEKEGCSETEMMLIFQSLEMILLRTASDLSHFSIVGTNIVKKVVSSHMKLLQNSLASGRHQLARQCLSLLAAMVSQGADCAREIFSGLNFNKTLLNLARIRDRAGRPDVRMSYIQFALSFLMCGDSSVIGHILDTKGFLSEIFTGLKEDRISVVSLVLSTLQTKVVHSTSISKSQKVRFFSASALTQIASLYKWNGIPDTASSDSQAVNKQEGGRLLVRDLVHNFLLDVCCSCKHGISFYDPSLGTAQRTGNLVLLQFAVSLKQATEDELVCELLVSVLKHSPDLLPRFFKETPFSFAPRAKGAWLDSITLLKKIYQAQPEVSQAFQSHEAIPVPRLLNMVLVTSLPPVCNKTFFTQGLKLPIVGQHATLSVLVFILKRAQKNMEHSLKRAVWDSLDAYSSSAMEEFTQLYREALSKLVPDVMSIVSTWQSLSKKEKDGDENTAEKETKSGEEVKTQETCNGENDPKLILCKALLLQVLCLYQKVVPHLISQSRFDFSKLLQGIISEKGLKNEVPPVLQYQILQLALELPASKFSWFRLQDAVSAGPGQGEGSVFYLLLKMYISSSSTNLQSSTRKLLLKVLRDSGVFEHTWSELEMWVDHLLSLESSHQETVLLFLDQVLMKVVNNPYVYMDKVAAMVQEAVCLQAEGSGQDRETDSSQIPCLSDTPLMEDSGDGVEEDGASLSDEVLHSFPFSSLVPAVLEARNKLLLRSREEKGGVCKYVCAVLCELLHSQRDPLTLCVTLQHHDKELLSAENLILPHPCLHSFCLYYSKWLPHHPLETWFNIPRSTPTPPASDISSFLKQCYSEGAESFLQESFRPATETFLTKLQLSNFPSAVNQILLYLRSFVNTFSSLPKAQAAEVVGSLLKLLHTLLLKLKNTEETPQTQAESQEPEELSLEMDFTYDQQVSREKVLLSVIRSALKNPVLEKWFLAVELDVVPSHSLDQECVIQLCVQLTEGVLRLLQFSAEILRDLNSPELLSSYLFSTKKALLRELQHVNKGFKEKSLCVTAFLALYEFMDPSAVDEVLSAILLLQQRHLVSEGGELSVYSTAVITVLTKTSSTPGKYSAAYMSAAHLHNLATLHASCQSAQLEEVLLQVLEKEPGNAKLIPAEVLLHCLQHRSSLLLAALLVKNCSTHCLSFDLWCLEQNDLSFITAPNQGALSLLSSYVQLAGTLDPCRPIKIQKTVLQLLTKVFLTQLLSSVLQTEADASLDQSIEVLSNLVQLGTVAPGQTQLISNLPPLLQKPEGYERWLLADSISEKLVGSPEELHWRKSLLSAAFLWLSATYKEQKNPQIKREENMLKRLRTLLSAPEHVEASEWNAFVKSGLKYRYQDSGFLTTLNTMLELMYGNVKTSKELLSVEILHMMVTSHSLFLPTMLEPHSEAESSSQCKEALLSLLLSLVKHHPEVCNSSHFPVLLGAYGATLSPTDQKLLLLLKEYEKKNISLLDFQCLLWGSAAVEHQKARKHLGPSLWQQPSCEQILSQLSPDRMLNTVTHFPLDRLLVPQGEEVVFLEGRESVYDPCFLLPLFSFILRPESVVDCQKFVSTHALDVSVVAFSSRDSNMRSAAYHILSTFYEHLEGAHFREKRQLLYLLDTVRNSVQKQNLRVSFLHTTYIAKVAQQILRPEEHMYLVTNRFLLGTQYVDLYRVPDFFKLFYSFDMEHKLEREWILNVLDEGMMDKLCFDMCEQQGVFHTLLGFCSSCLCDHPAQMQVINVLRKSSLITKAAYELIKAHGVLTWIVQLIEKRSVDGRLLSAVIGLISSLWFSHPGQNQTGSGQNQAEMESSASEETARRFPISVISDFLCALFSVIKLFRSGMEVSVVQRLLQTLASVLKHYKESLSACRDTGWITMRSYEVSGSEALSLLQFCGTLFQDRALLSSLQLLTNKHSIKALHEPNKQKLRGKAYPKLPQSCTEPVCEEREGSLEKCKCLLVNVLTHWELGPVRPCAEGLVYETAHILFKWTMKTLCEIPYDENNTCVALKWMQSAITSHKTVVKSLLSDEAVRADLLKLYHKTCLSKLDAFQLCTTIMLHLLEAELTSNIFHLTVTKVCLHTSEDDATKRETGLKLLSLYIPELWTGAKVPQLLLTHARLLTKGQKKTKKNQSPVVHMCEDILSAWTVLKN